MVADRHNVALCSDGTVAAWGNNYRGQLGNGDESDTLFTPVLVDQTGVLAGKRIVDLVAGRDFSAVLCADGGNLTVLRRRGARDKELATMKRGITACSAPCVRPSSSGTPRAPARRRRPVA